jgi:hypothetical protein
MRTATQTQQELATQVGGGDHAAFRRLYAAFAPETLAAIRGDLPDLTQSTHVVRATFCEVWWMCAFDVRYRTTPHDLPMWIAAIAQRRGNERRHALALIQSQLPQGSAAFWTGLLADHDQWTHFELTTMLDGPDNITLPAKPGPPQNGRRDRSNPNGPTPAVYPQAAQNRPAGRRLPVAGEARQTRIRD